MPQQDHATSLQNKIEQLGHSLALIALAALASPVSQHVLAPVYGSLPSSINHHIALPLTFLLGFILHGAIVRDDGTRRELIRNLPFLAALVPTLANVALSQSEKLDVVAGPIVAGLVSCHVIVISAAFAAAESMQRLKIGNWSNSLAASLANASIALLPFTLLERFFSDQLPDVLSSSPFLAPADIQLVIAGAFCLLANPSERILFPIGLIVISTWVFNPHGKGYLADRTVNASLAKSNWTMLARSWSTTGYVSVLESTADAHRVLRCDHSLLGGEWLLTDERRALGWTANEPIYSVFSTLEAVRLIEGQGRPQDEHAKALVIGLGVGNAPSAMIQLGISTTIVELDRMVLDYAVRFFSLPTNHTAIISDAVAWVHQQSTKDAFDIPRFDYIIHDVFTGGAEPLSLFTSLFLRELRSLLSPYGVVAINYAGDLQDPLTSRVLNTIELAFDRQCRIYGDNPPDQKGNISFDNFVVFCRNDPGPISFRQPTEADFLGSLIRRDHLKPKPAKRVVLPAASQKASNVLESADLSRWRSTQAESAKRHWHVMRTVLPARVWEAY